jgi:hypothetical protein
MTENAAPSPTGGALVTIIGSVENVFVVGFYRPLAANLRAKKPHRSGV